MKLARTFSALSLLLILSSCAHTSKPDADKDANGKKVEYVTIYPTGSNIPVRVPKSSAATSASDTEASQNEMTNLQNQAAADKGPPTPGGR